MIANVQSVNEFFFLLNYVFFISHVVIDHHHLTWHASTPNFECSKIEKKKRKENMRDREKKQ